MSAVLEEIVRARWPLDRPEVFKRWQQQIRDEYLTPQVAPMPDATPDKPKSKEKP